MSQVENIISEDLNLATSFTIPEFSIWREAAEMALKGADFEKRLYTQTLEKITLHPLYTESHQQAHLPQKPGEGDGRRAQHTGWLIAQEYRYSDEDYLLEALKSDRPKGLDCAEIKLDHLNANTIKRLLQSNLDLPLQFHTNRPEIVSQLPDLLSMPQHAHTSEARFSIDPLGSWLNGETNNVSPLFEQLAELYTQHQQMDFLEVSGLPYHNAGAHAAQELAYVMAGLIESIEQLKTQGLSAQQVLSHCRISLGSGVQFFMELSKFRAVRILLKRISQAYQVEEQPQIHARTGTLWLSLYDPYVNFLRQTVGSLAAIAGGAERVSSGCFNERCGQADVFARRLARNLQLILKDEVHLNQVIDPAGGSYFIEQLTTDLAQSAWQELQKIESQGGLLAVLKTGAIQDSVHETARQRDQAIRTRKQVIIGTTAYADPQEKQTMPHIVANWPEKKQAIPTDQAPLSPIYLAADFEQLRKETENSAQSVLLLGLGQSRDWLARSDFARAFFQVAGLNVLQANAAETKEALTYVSKHQPNILVLCSTDADYETWLPELVPALRAQDGKLKIVLAGKPQATETHQNAALDQYIYLGCDVLKSLESLRL